MRRSLAAAIVACAFVTGCADPGDPASDPRKAAVEPDSDASTNAGAEPTEASSSPPSAPGPVAAAVADLARTLGVAAASVQVVSEEEVTWRDGSLGCAEKGTMYTQALVEGSRIVLRADGTDYEYHSGRGGTPFHCPSPTQ